CILKEANIKNFKSLQYPVNIRIVNNFSNPHYTDYDTRLIHCDAWSGAPKDSINGFIYIFVENNCPKIEIYNPLNKEDELRDYLGSYKKVNINKRKLKKINFLTEVGNFIMWETYTPHRSILDEKKKRKENFRVSLDFRIRYNNPYLKNSSLAIKKNIVNSKYYNPLMYWNVKKNLTGFHDLKSKIKYELMAAKKIDISSYKKRLNYLKKFYSDK
ncbi:hypothetical protein N9F75_02240, partial [Candidatus Pelagibacter ubique]|nr:hypothetical protein [Candidatus Pelagibacter ubique]